MYCKVPIVKAIIETLKINQKLSKMKFWGKKTLKIV